MGEITNVSEYQAIAKEKLPKMAYDYYASGTEDQWTLAENRNAFSRILFRPRILIDVSKIDMTTTVLGFKISMPIMIAPTAFQKIAHPEGLSTWQSEGSKLWSGSQPAGRGKGSNHGNTRSTESRIDGLEKAVEGLMSSLDDRISKCLDVRWALCWISSWSLCLRNSKRVGDSGGSHTPPHVDSTDTAEQQHTDSATLGPVVVAASGQPPSNSPMALPSGCLDIAIIALAGPALPWFQILRRRRPSICWEQFASELLQRFGDDNARNSYEAFSATKHRGALSDYIRESESKLAQLPDLTDIQYMGFFLANLKPQLRAQLQDLSIHTYSDPVHLAKRSPASYTNKSSSGRALSVVNGTTPTHRCPPKTLQVIVGNDDEDDSDGEFMTEETPTVIPEGLDSAVLQNLQFSELSSKGFDSPQTMKMLGFIGQVHVTMMIDSGASHCFMSEHVSHRLGLHVSPTAPFSVRLGDGSKVRSGGFCPNISLQLASEGMSKLIGAP
ncbi:hypothetical protein SASPL_154219 [Salvia splendens]|uniref:FMN hydroxy acid dehydrogenase domain-containing protein n=1 Tax=Salvia splendens TaxID=180675 RepID=A0A8X8VZS7_SALSN|nr:hypothetical protein SASPL_154219 [Salvia splendens]